MKILKWLLINHILRMTKWNELKYNGKNHKKNGKYILVGLAFLLFACIWLAKIFEITKEFTESILYVEYMLFPLIVSAVLFTIGSFAIKGVGILYYGDDLNLLFSMPIKMYQIVLSKIILLEFYVIGIDVILVYPSIFFYGVLNNAEIGYYVINFINLYFIMIIPSLIGIGLGICIYRIIRLLGTNNSKIRTVIEITMLIIFICFVVFFTIKKENLVEVIHFLQSKTQFCINYIYKMFLMQNEIVVWSWIVLLLIGSVAFIVITISYRKINFILSLSNQRNKLVKISLLKKHNLLIALIIREKERYFSIPVYVLNTMLGIVLLLIYIVTMFFLYDSLLSYMTIINASFGKSRITVGIINAFIIAICIVLTNITSSSISIEGKRHTALKAYPIEARRFFEAKILFQLSITIPAVIITNTIAIVAFHLNIVESIIGYALPAVFAILSSLLGCLINVCFPNYEWKNIAFIVKQSIAAILSVFINLGAVVGMIYIICRYCNENILQSLYVICGGIFLIDVILIGTFALRSEKFYERL